jgi:hypothetical protein
MWGWRYSSTISDLGTGWKSMVSFTLQSLYAQRKRLRYPLDRRLGGSHNWSGRRGENSCPYWNSNSNPSAVQPAACRYTSRFSEERRWITELHGVTSQKAVIILFIVITVTFYFAVGLNTFLLRLYMDMMMEGIHLEQTEPSSFFLP